MRRNLKRTDADAISQFISENKYDFYADKLLESWLHYLAKTKKWTLFLQHYQPRMSSAKLQCLRLRALIKTNNIKQVLTDVVDLWLVPYSQDKGV